MMKKKTRNKIQIEHNLRDFCNGIIDIYKNIYRGFPDNLLHEQDDLIKWFARSTPKEYVPVLENANYALDVLEDSISSTRELIISAIHNDDLALWDSKELIDNFLPRCEDHQFLLSQAHNHSFAGTILGVSLVFWLAVRRREYQLLQKGTIDYVFLANTDILETDKHSHTALKTARERLSTKTMMLYNRGRIDTESNKCLFTSAIWERLQNITPNRADLMELAENGSGKIKNAELAAARTMKKENNKRIEIAAAQKLKKKNNKQKEIRWEWENKKIYPIENVKDFSFLDRIYNVVQTTKALAGITDPLDKDIVQLLCKGFTIREIADKLSVPKSTVYDHLTRLNPPD